MARKLKKQVPPVLLVGLDAKHHRLGKTAGGQSHRRKKKKKKPRVHQPIPQPNPDPKPKRPRIPYHDYLYSRWWRTRRYQYLKRVKFQCERCPSKSELHVHHLNYDRLWGERNKDLECLCRECHEFEHQGIIQANAHLAAISREVI